MILVVQGFVLRHLLLKNLLSQNKHRLTSNDFIIIFNFSVFFSSVSVSVEARTEALVDALTEVNCSRRHKLTIEFSCSKNRFFGKQVKNEALQFAFPMLVMNVLQPMAIIMYLMG